MSRTLRTSQEIAPLVIIAANERLEGVSALYEKIIREKEEEERGRGRTCGRGRTQTRGAFRESQKVPHKRSVDMVRWFLLSD